MFFFPTIAPWTSGQIVVNNSSGQRLYSLLSDQPTWPILVCLFILFLVKMLQLLQGVHFGTALYDMCVCHTHSESSIDMGGSQNCASNWHFLARKSWWFSAWDFIGCSMMCHIFRHSLRYLTFSSHSIRHGHEIFRSEPYLPKNINQAGWPKWDTAGYTLQDKQLSGGLVSLVHLKKADVFLAVSPAWAASTQLARSKSTPLLFQSIPFGSFGPVHCIGKVRLKFWWCSANHSDHQVQFH